VQRECFTITTIKGESMNNMMKKFKPLMLVAAFLATCSAQSAFAAGTLAGTSITNSASLSYTVGGVSQTAVPSNTATFVVDDKVNMTMTPQATYTTVVPGATAQVTVFTLTNSGNSTQDFGLLATALASGQTVYSKTSNFVANNCKSFVDANNNGTYEPATDTGTYVDELAPDTSIKVFAVCDIPSTRVNNDYAAVSMVATAEVGGTPGSQGAVLTQTTGAKNNATIAIVFGDAAGTDDAANDGKISARSAYLVQSATLTMTKSVVALCDPINFNNNPKLIPGAYAQYTITVSNAAGSGASGILANVTDSLVSSLTFDPNLIKPTASSCATPQKAAGTGFEITCTGGSRACTSASTPIYVTTAAGYSAPTVNVNMGSSLPVESGYLAGLSLNPFSSDG
jgi:hypothetical protein